jgi:hypothetical protein
MLRAAGFDVIAQPGEETWVCISAEVPSDRNDLAGREAARIAAASLDKEKRG